MLSLAMTSVEWKRLLYSDALESVKFAHTISSLDCATVVESSSDASDALLDGTSDELANRFTVLALNSTALST